MVMKPKNVMIVEVGPRDGLQNEPNLIKTEVKEQFIKKLWASGIQEMELTSFVSPKWVPQMADSKEIVEKNSTNSGRKIVLVPNLKGVQLADDANATELAFFIGVSDTFNKKNINRSTNEALMELLPLIKQLKEQKKWLRICISTAFYCPYEGKIDPNNVLSLCQKFIQYGVDDISVADTIGMANPQEVAFLFSLLKEAFPSTTFSAHFHDTRGMALSNIYTALQAGITRFDCSAGGLGGCPFAKGATGNVATEDALTLFESLGIETGIDINKLFQAIDLLAPHLSSPILSKNYLLYSRQKSTV
ncbi:hydroxymethylglutaryl-CoA lyase [Bacillus carboniphilus]|uniref:Hydroxymethylglutaryl-CoA lyase n=1 Tax=Bacillus carboniphilus TaxID=86663 RepID=A0ABY9K1U6_9BACI|nr:hydroxymethylglutaryl-CoA lyase [Bacillus carboniphilus]WLR43820.1 hydroxymethylglutaryl-CoA lyase [Bacillus carboniphilus]